MDETARRTGTSAASLFLFTKNDISRLQSLIEATTRPSYSCGPPKKIGTKAQGKLKADAWKAGIEFELTVYLMKEWYSQDTSTIGNDEGRALRHGLAVSTIHLACAVRQATSYITSPSHQASCTAHMRLYLASLLKYRPDIPLRPCHHNAQHFPDFLPRFGPSPGWWMFPFERVNGLLQQVNTNGKQGQSSILSLA